MNGSDNFTKQLSKFLRRYHLVLFVVTVVGSMAIVIFVINEALLSSTDTSDIVSSDPTRLDQATIDRVNALKPTQNQEPLNMPAGQRANPFIE